jgi:hypothetical protein
MRIYFNKYKITRMMFLSILGIIFYRALCSFKNVNAVDDKFVFRKKTPP